MLPQFVSRYRASKSVILFFAVVMQACLGGTYSWSVYDALFIKQYQVPAPLATAPFNLFYVVFPIMLLFANKLIERFGPRKCAMLGGGLFGCGWIVACLGVTSFYFTLLGVGLLGGLGVGIAYLIPITVGVAWYPQRRGLVTGLAVAGFAAGAALVSQVSQYLLTVGISPYAVLGAIGGCYAVIGIVAGFFMSYPESYSAKQVAPIQIKRVMKDPLFLTLFIAMTAGLTAGFFINSKLALLSRDNGIELALSAVAIFAVSNAAGRLIWGYLSDRSPPSTTIKLNLFIQAMVIALSPVLLQSDWGTALLACATGFNYGGVLVLYAASAGHYWGNGAMKTIYAWLFLSNILAALINILLGSLYATAGLNVPIVTLLVMLGFAYLLSGRNLRQNRAGHSEVMLNETL